jgi:hypothetical protein
MTFDVLSFGRNPVHLSLSLATFCLIVYLAISFLFLSKRCVSIQYIDPQNVQTNQIYQSINPCLLLHLRIELCLSITPGPAGPHKSHSISYLRRVAFHTTTFYSTSRLRIQHADHDISPGVYKPKTSSSSTPSSEKTLS